MNTKIREDIEYIEKTMELVNAELSKTWEERKILSYITRHIDEALHILRGVAEKRVYVLRLPNRKGIIVEE